MAHNNATTTTTDTTSICTRALLVWLSISTWSARKYDRKVTQQVNAEHAAVSDAGRYNKMLLPGDAPTYKSLVSLCGAIREESYARTLAWSDTGWRCLPSAAFTDYTDWYRRRDADLSRAVDAFVADYPNLRASAKQRLNGMFNDADYPSSLDLRAKFALNLSYMPIAADGDVRVNLNADAVAMIEREVQGKIAASLDTAVRDAWTRLQDVTQKIADRLTDPDAIFRDSLILNARETCTLLAKLNVTGDADLDAMRRRVEHDLTRYDAQALRDFPDQRARVADRASQLLDDMRKIGMVA